MEQIWPKGRLRILATGSNVDALGNFSQPVCFQKGQGVRTVGDLIDDDEEIDILKVQRPDGPEWNR